MDLDKVIHQPVRTRLVAHLAGHGSADYSTLKKTFELTDGHMSTHMKELVGSGYVEAEKSFVDNKPKTTYRLTKLGKQRFADYVKALRAIVSIK